MLQYVSLTSHMTLFLICIIVYGSTQPLECEYIKSEYQNGWVSIIFGWSDCNMDIFLCLFTFSAKRVKLGYIVAAPEYIKTTNCQGSCWKWIRLIWTWKITHLKHSQIFLTYSVVLFYYTRLNSYKGGTTQRKPVNKENKNINRKHSMRLTICFTRLTSNCIYNKFRPQTTWAILYKAGRNRQDLQYKKGKIDLPSTHNKWRNREHGRILNMQISRFLTKHIHIT